MTVRKLERYGGYDGVNGGIHRKAASLVGHPSLVRFLGLWEVSPSDPEGHRSEEHRLKAISEYLQDLWTVIVAADKAASHSNPLDMGAGELGRTVIFKFLWNGISSTLRFEYAREFVGCTAILDLSLVPRDAAGSTIDPSTIDLCNAISRDLLRLNRLQADTKSKTGTSRRTPRDSKKVVSEAQATYGELQTFVYEGIWRQFTEAIIDAKLSETDDDGILSTRLGCVFADFRGLVTGDPIREGVLGKLVPQSAFQPPFYKDDNSRAGRHAAEEMADDVAWASKVVDRIWPFLSAGNETAEFSVSRFLDGRVIYATALGPQDEQVENPEKWTHITYYMHARTDDQWQIGRLVDRIHYCGAMRLAAMMQLADLMRVNTQLTALDEKITEVRELIQIKNSESTQTPVITHQQAQAQLADRRMRANELKTHLAAIKALELDMIKGFDGNIEFRIEQSRYYVARFRSACEGLRCKRFEGFQPYQDFVQRRLGYAFTFIDLLTAQIKRFKANLTLLHGDFMAYDTADATHSIRMLSEKSTHLENAIEDIQDVGEIILLTVIAPHYLVETVFRLYWAASEPASHEGERIAIALAVMMGCGLSFARILNSTARRVEQDTSKKVMSFRKTGTLTPADKLLRAGQWTGTVLVHAFKTGNYRVKLGAIAAVMAANFIGILGIPLNDSRVVSQPPPISESAGKGNLPATRPQQVAQPEKSVPSVQHQPSRSPRNRPKRHRAHVKSKRTLHLRA